MSKRSRWLKMNSNSSPVLSNDVLIDIFLRLDPSSVFNCILVCRDWLGVIAKPDFRQDYLKIWSDHPKLLVGFLTYRYQFLWTRETEFCDCSDRTIVTFLATSKLGRIIKASEPMQRPGYMISKSSSNDGFLLFGTIPNTFYVCKPSTNATHELPSPPVRYEKVAAAVITRDSDHFQVIVARTKACSDNTLDIQTFSSSTSKWEESKTPCYRDLRLTGEPGLVSSKGTVYWSDYSNLAAYDANNRRISLIPQPWHKVENSCSYPVEDDLHCYGVSAQGSIYCATHVLCKDWVAAMGTIQVWVLDETSDLDETDDEDDDDDSKHWKLMYKANPESMWVKHASILEPVFGGKPSMPFRFVSLVHGTTNCIYVELERVLFLYNLDTQELDRVGPGSYYESEDVPDGFCIPRNKKLPLTLPELGMWPVSSPVLHLR